MGMEETTMTFYVGWVMVIVAVVLSGCHWSGERRLTSTSRALSEAAEMCLYDVRDRKLAYESSSSCNSLGILAEAFIEAGGYAPTTPEKYAIIGAEVRATAWMARAVSFADGKAVKIW